MRDVVACRICGEGVFVSFVKNIGGSAEVAKGDIFSESVDRGYEKEDSFGL